MAARFTYILVVLIWSTTPLAIKLGNASFAPMANVSLRIALAVMVGSIVCTVTGYGVLNIRRHWLLYLAASVGIFPNMILVYTAAEYISSGLISVLFGLTPFFTAVLGRVLFGDVGVSRLQAVAIALACVGLACIFVEPGGEYSEAYTGVLLMLVSNVLFSLSALWVKTLGARFDVAPTEQAIGAMVFALPGLLLFWFVVEGYEPIEFTVGSSLALLYLALCGSLLGFVAYYFILKSMSVGAVALIPLMSPVLAIFLGSLVINEPISVMMVVGVGIIIVALAMHQGILLALVHRLRRR